MGNDTEDVASATNTIIIDDQQPATAQDDFLPDTAMEGEPERCLSPTFASAHLAHTECGVLCCALCVSSAV